MNTQNWAWLALYFYVGLGGFGAVALIVATVLNVMDAERTMRGQWRR